MKFIRVINALKSYVQTFGLSRLVCCILALSWISLIFLSTACFMRLQACVVSPDVRLLMSQSKLYDRHVPIAITMVKWSAVIVSTDQHRVLILCLRHRRHRRNNRLCSDSNALALCIVHRYSLMTTSEL